MAEDGRLPAAPGHSAEPEPKVSALRASVPSAFAAYPDCKFCGGYGYFNVTSIDEKVACGNCFERHRLEGIVREEQDSWCVWTKTGRRSQYFYSTQTGAENEAIRLARKHPTKSFIVFQKCAKFSVAQAIEARSGETAKTGAIREADESAVAPAMRPETPEPSAPKAQD